MSIASRPLELGGNAVSERAGGEAKHISVYPLRPKRDGIQLSALIAD